jgi:hypothetical protein
MRRLALLVPLVLPGWWMHRAGDTALGQRSGDMVSHVWAIWNGARAWPGDPTFSAMVGWPEGTDLLVFYGGWGHTLVGVAAALLLGVDPAVAYTIALCMWLVVAGWGGHALARSLGASTLGAVAAGLVLQLDGIVLYHATDGRPEHAGVGMAALALAGAVTAWRGEGGYRRAVATGLLGAACLVVGWELGVWLAGAMLVLAPFFWWSGRPPGALRRWGVAAGVTALVAAPWVLVFLARATASRNLLEGHGTMSWAVDQSLPLLAWAVGATHHPSSLAMAALLLIPWTARPGERRVWIGAALGLVMSLVLAAGPSPGLFHPGDLAPDGGHWGPYAWLQGLPLLGWFHSPARIALGWSLAAAAAAGLAVSWAGRRSVWLAVAAGVVFVGEAGWEAERAGTWPGRGMALPRWEAPRELGASSGTGALLDLPLHTGGVWSEDAQLMQIFHERPTPGSGFMAHLAPDRSEAVLTHSPLLRWLSEGAQGEAPAWTAEEQQALRDEGLRYVAVHPLRFGRDRLGDMDTALRAQLGPPAFQMGHRWWCWDLDAVQAPAASVPGVAP